MRFADLSPALLKFEQAGENYGFRRVGSIAEADGIMFACPKCYQTNGDTSIGTHRIIWWAPGVPLDMSLGPGRWELLGTGFDDLTLRAGSSSVLLTGGCEAHFFVTNGSIQHC